MTSRQIAAAQVAVLLWLGLGVFLPNLGSERYIASREARHAEIARQMVIRGDYLIPYLWDEPYVLKPPLFNWLVAGLYRLTDRVDFLTARLPSALSAVLILPGLYVLGRRWLGPRAAEWSALIWMTSFLNVRWARIARADMFMAMLVLYAAVLVSLAAHARQRGQVWRRR